VDIPENTLGIVGFVVLLLLAFIAFFAIVFGGVFVVLRNTARRKEASARAQYPNARQIDRAASFFGQESRGVAQMRGNGTLILTDTELIFEMWVPNNTFRIPLRHIQSLENPRSFLGKSRFTPLLKVVYTNEQGTKDAMAWQVPDLNGWMRHINEARA
jgi:type II secretory pathway component PulJ